MKKGMLPLALFGILALSGYLFERWAEHLDRRRFRPKGTRVDIGGRKMHLICLGQRKPGQPLIILESGHGDWSVGWQPVLPKLAQLGRVCAYDRAGFGWSDPGPLPRSPGQIARDLHALLEKAGEPGPYLLVGHSLGGALCRMFASLYPEEVVGMVWVDSAHEDMDRFISVWPPAYWGIVLLAQLGKALASVGFIRLVGRRLLLFWFPSAQSLAEQAEVAALTVTPQFFETLREETTGWRPRANWAGGRQSFGSLPVIMLEALYTSHRPRVIPRRLWNVYLAGWRAIQDEISLRSENLQRIPVDSGHVIQTFYPDLVVQAVKDLLERLGFLAA